ncbi:signal transduction histidine kinase [Rhodoglobus vestalii]|uniref:Signal transduction histidine kinase n=1 Tax=Rhodoglobus vestalii TaxID=193384 RepID=A0A8H2PUP6_9MICO|nr:ATP-binding protein [Rhodoglobus vestalii]TQO20736.1 signal transduction histidine kinase [Rhodoglobus vestalii]
MVARLEVARQAPAVKQPRNPISRKQVERVISRSVAVIGVVFGVQTIPWLLSQLDEAQPWWLIVTVPSLFGLLIVVVVASFANRWVREAHGTFAVIYFLALVSWPFTVLPGVEVFNGIHWLDYLITVGTAMATIAFRPVLAGIYLFAAPIVYGIVRSLPEGGGATVELAILESFYALILGSAIMIIVTMLRQAASTVDNAQATALGRYGNAVRQHATEVERVQVDSILHDSVLTTLISAARSYTPEAERLSAVMAGNAIGHLKEAASTSPDDRSTVQATELAGRVVTSAEMLDSNFTCSVRSVGARSFPAIAAEAVHSAAVQAMVNSLQHAGGSDVERHVTVRGLEGNGIEVQVIDTGRGFDLDRIPDERFGVRVSIVERVANAGGRTMIRSAPGTGTLVCIQWPLGDEKYGAPSDDDGDGRTS